MSLNIFYSQLQENIKAFTMVQTIHNIEIQVLFYQMPQVPEVSSCWPSTQIECNRKAKAPSIIRFPNKEQDKHRYHRTQHPER